jgi:hypothetical protein
MGSAQDGTPDGPKLHSVIVDPRDPSHLVFAMSGGGVHESRDTGRSWSTLIKGLEVVEGFDAGTVTFHDPHCVRLCPGQPDRLYQQNHCGIYRPDRLAPPAARRPQDAQARGRHWFSDGRAPTRRRHGLGLPHGWHDRLASHQPGRAPGGLRDAQCRQVLATAGPGPARKPGLVDVQAPSHDGGRTGQAGAVSGDYQRRVVDRPRRRRKLVEHRPAPPGDLTRKWPN